MYIHIPFCKSKCFYCDFVSYGCKENYVKQYINLLKQEISEKIKKIDEKVLIGTVYIGGGTPSYIDSKYICEILQSEEIKNNLKENCEITIEINPGTITEKKLLQYKETGINRISIGLQTTCNELLKKIGRIHTYEQFLENYNLARKIGFKNINVDLMLALPNQTISILEKSVQEVVNLKPEHISIYSLILEEDTKLYEMVNSNKINLPTEEEEREMYWKTKKMLEQNNYNHYEISNFSKPGYESKHNIDCWNQKEYLGFGLAAHSYYNDIRYSNTIVIEEYIKNINQKQMKKNIVVNEIQNIDDKQKEYVMLGLRKIDGVSLKSFKKKFNQNLEDVFENEIQVLKKEKLIKLENDKMKLSSLGIDFANIVWEKFV